MRFTHRPQRKSFNQGCNLSANCRIATNEQRAISLPHQASGDWRSVPEQMDHGAGEDGIYQNPWRSRSRDTDANYTQQEIASTMKTYPVLHHVGIVQSNESDALEQMSLLGLEEEYRGFVPQWSALCIFAKSSGGSQIEYVIPSGGPLAKFNNGAGGIHHIAFEVADLRALEMELEADGMKFIESKAVRGAGKFICNFLSPIYTRGLRVEYVQLVATD